MALFDSLNQLNESRRGTKRRQFLIGALGAVGAYFGYRWWRFRARPLQQRQTAYVTPNEKFYTVSIDAGFRPNVKRDEWRLEVSGAAGRFALSYDELLKLERRRVFRTLMCVGNETGGPSLDNAEWTVTPLAPLVQRVLGQSDEDLRVAFYALDGFYSSVPLHVALSDEAFIAYEMNGAVLPLAHGYPARVLLPDKYGMKQPRWLTKIEVTERRVRGHWENRGWSYDCDVKMTARMEAAMPGNNGAWLVTGVAYCGAQAVGQVEVSFDEGAIWQPARLTSERLPNAWATWECAWQPAHKGEHTLVARVTDAAGQKQIDTYSSSFPSGATGWQRVLLKV